MMTSKPVFALLVAFVLGLTACDKPPTPTPSNNTTSDNTNSTNSQNPTNGTYLNFLDFQIDASRFLVMNTINEDYPNLTPEQQACLGSDEGDANYLSVLEPHFKKILTADEMKEADEFFASEAGQRFGTIINNINKDPSSTTTPTDEEKAFIVQTVNQPFFTKVEAYTQQMSDEEALAYLYGISDKEIVRCHIQPTQNNATQK